MRSAHRSKKAYFMRKVVLKSACFVSKNTKSHFGQSFESNWRFRIRVSKQLLNRCLKSTCFSDMTSHFKSGSRLENRWRDRKDEKERQEPGGGAY